MAVRWFEVRPCESKPEMSRLAAPEVEAAASEVEAAAPEAVTAALEAAAAEALAVGRSCLQGRSAS